MGDEVGLGDGTGAVVVDEGSDGWGVSWETKWRRGREWWKSGPEERKEGWEGLSV